MIKISARDLFNFDDLCDGVWELCGRPKLEHASQWCHCWHFLR